jgi:mannose-1-phosphate guanylyltransferase
VPVPVPVPVPGSAPLGLLVLLCTPMPRAMILAAGFGTRLGALTRLRPKPMLPVCGAPLVRWAVLWLRHHGIREIVINLHHLGEQIEAELGDGRDLDVSIVYSHEEGLILGTGGGLRQARAALDDGREGPIVVVNGKILVDLDLGAVIARHVETNAEATMVLRPDPDAERWGSFRCSEDGRIVRMLDLDPASGPIPSASDPLMFTGVQVLTPRFLDRIPPEGEQCVVRTAYRSLFDEGRGLYGWRTDRYWWEHSTEQRYLQGIVNVLDGLVDLPYAPRPVAGIDPTAQVHPEARVQAPVYIGANVSVGAKAVVGPHVQLGDGARVEAGARLQRCAVWEGVTVAGEHVDTVLAADPDA